MQNFRRQRLLNDDHSFFSILEGSKYRHTLVRSYRRDATRVLVQSLGQIDLLVNKNGTPKKACMLCNLS